MKMTKRLLLPLLLLGALLAAAPAQANYIVGVGDQSANLFEDPLWQDLKLKRVRYIVAWDALSEPTQRDDVVRYMTAARAKKQEVLLHLSGKRGCFDGKYSKSKECRAPSVSAYTKAFKAYKKAFPYVKTYGVWNEANSTSQPTAKNPKRVAQYYTALKKNCRGCKVVAGDLLDSSNLRSYASTMNKALKGRAKVWGLHNYGDVNRNRTKGTTTMLKTVPGEVWVTETGGIVRFTGSRIKPKPSLKQAVKSIGNMFRLAARYDSKGTGLKSRITRLYQYNFREVANARFDAALLNPDGSKRPSYDAFKKGIRKLKR